MGGTTQEQPGALAQEVEPESVEQARERIRATSHPEESGARSGGETATASQGTSERMKLWSAAGRHRYRSPTLNGVAACP